MAIHQQLQHKLAEVTKKLRLVCQSYKELKEKLRGKDEEISRLKMDICRMMEAEQMKENNRVKEIRKKYEMESTFRPIDKPVPRILLEDNESRVLKNVRSLSPHQFAKPMQMVEPLKKSTKNVQKQPRKPVIPLNFSFPTTMPSAIDLNKSRAKTKQIIDIDHRYSKDLEPREHRHAQSSQADMLKQLWEERDKEIKRMDDLFENLNKRIYGS